MKLPVFFKSKKLSAGIIRVILVMSLLIMVGYSMRACYDCYIDYETQKYINLPVIKKEIIPTNSDFEGYMIINDSYSFKCWIDHYIPYQQDIDTFFVVKNKAGKQLFGFRNERILTDFFREQFDW